MKVAILKTIGSRLVIENGPDPTPKIGEVVVDVIAAPVISYSKDVFSGVRKYPFLLPMIPGASAIAKVRELGADATDLKIGDLVYCDPTVRARDKIMSPDIMLQGWIAPTEAAKILQKNFPNGSFAERMLVPMENVVKLNLEISNFDLAKLCMIGSFLVPYGGLLASELKAGETVLISGATGHFGSSGIAVALAMGAAMVIAPGRNKSSLSELSKKFGSRIRTVELTGNQGEDTKRMKEAVNTPIDKVIDILPPMESALPTIAAIMAVRPNGTVVLMGGLDVDVNLPYKFLMRNSITVRGQYMYSREAVINLLGLIRSGLISLDLFKVEAFNLEKINDAVDMLMSIQDC